MKEKIIGLLFDVVSLVYAIFKSEQPRLKFREVVLVVVWGVAAGAMFAYYKEMSTFWKLLTLCSWLLCSIALWEKAIWPRVGKKISLFFTQNRERIYIIAFILSVIVLMAILAVIIIWQFKAANQDISSPINTSLPIEETPSQEAAANANLSFRMRAAERLPIGDKENYWENDFFWNQEIIRRKDIKAIQFCRDFSEIEEIRVELKNFCWDVSARSDNTVIACFDNEGTLWVAADGIIELSENSAFLFAGFSNVEKISFNDSVDSSYTTDMSNMFAMCKSLTDLELEDLSTANVKDMSRMFYRCESMTDFRLAKMDTSQVNDMGNMFSYCYALTSLDASNFSTPFLNDIGNMFYECKNLEFVDVSNFDTSNVTKLNGMFYRCEKLKSVDLSSWDLSKAAEMNNVFAESGIHEIMVSDLPNLNTASHYNFMPSESTINGVSWDDFSGNT